LDDHFQATLLSRPPNIGWLTPQGGFVEVSLSHIFDYILASFFAPCYNTFARTN